MSSSVSSKKRQGFFSNSWLGSYSDWVVHKRIIVIIFSCCYDYIISWMKCSWSWLQIWPVDTVFSVEDFELRFVINIIPAPYEEETTEHVFTNTQNVCLGKILHCYIIDTSSRTTTILMRNVIARLLHWCFTLKIDDWSNNFITNVPFPI